MVFLWNFQFAMSNPSFIRKEVQLQKNVRHIPQENFGIYFFWKPISIVFQRCVCVFSRANSFWDMILQKNVFSAIFVKIEKIDFCPDQSSQSWTEIFWESHFLTIRIIFAKFQPNWTTHCEKFMSWRGFAKLYDVLIFWMMYLFFCFNSYILLAPHFQ